MSRNQIILLVVLIAAIGGGVAWYVLRDKGGDLHIPANKNLPALPEPKIAAGDWPWWRGPARNGHSSDPEGPKKWSETENIVWKATIPGRGHSAPVLIGNRVFVTTADEGDQKQSALCLDRGTGNILWQKVVHEGNFGKKHGDNTFASGTPCSDGENLFVCFQNRDAIHVTALDFDGNILWSKEAGPHGGSGSHGTGSSLALWGSWVFVCDDSPSRGWIAALYRKTGEFGWRKDRKSGIGSYGSPIIAEFNGKPHLILAGSGKVTAYDPNSGDEIWSREGLAEVSGNTAAFSHDMIFASSGHPQRILLALKSDGSVAWTKKGNEAPYPPSTIYIDGHLYVVNDQGVAYCLDAATGEQRWSERLRGGYYASPIRVGKHIYACNREGLTTIFEASPEGLIEVGKNKLAKGINASPVAAGGRLFIRTETDLYCIGK